MSYCNIPENIAGPYNQVLFLGCSITSFNCNLGWGAEQSTLNVNLIEDNCFHPQSTEYSALDTKLDTLIQQDENAPGNNAFYKSANGGYNYNDPTKALHQNIAFQMKNQEDVRDQENITLSNDYKDYGKVCYDIDGNKTYWTDPDPMFLATSGKFHASGIDILGVPVRFKFNNFTFGGLVSSWKQNGSQAGSRSFEVEIKSFASLLNGCQLIINKYAGTVCGIVPNTNNNPTNENLAMPMPYDVDTSTTPPTFSFFDHTATINQGNIPNVFNIYGYLEYIGASTLNIPYGNAYVNDEGIRAQYVYDALISLLDPTTDNSPTNKTGFSPYGAIIARSPRVNGTADEVDPLNVTLNSGSGGGTTIDLTHMGICANSVGVDTYRRSRLKLDISEVPRPPKWLRLQGPVISIMQFITEICDGAGYDFFVDFISPDSNQTNQNISGIIKIRTVSRRKQPKKNQIDAFISYLTNNRGVSSYTKGKEFTDANTRTMYIGGSQKRLAQMKSSRLAFKQNTLIYDPWANGGNGAIIDYDTLPIGSFPNQVRDPDTRSTRRYSLKIKGGAAIVSNSDQFFQNVYFATPLDSRQIPKGNYLNAVQLAESQGFLGSVGPIGRNIELYKDNICPYFGVGANGLVRPVYFDKNMGQMQILFQTQDIQDLTALPLTQFNPFPAAGQTVSTTVTPIFLVLENEIRAAGGGFLPWLEYCFTNIFTTDIAQLLYKGFRDKYGFGDLALGNGGGIFAGDKFETEQFLTGISIALGIAAQKTRIVNGRPMQVSLDHLSPRMRSLYNDLENIHKFFENIANEYYGKKYMINLPRVYAYQDLAPALDDNGNQINLGTDELGNNIYGWEGSGKVYTSYSISTDGAWEEPGNMIDDTIMVGGIRLSAISDESGKIPCLIGFNASLEKDNSRLWHRQRLVWAAAQYNYSDCVNTHLVTDWVMIMQHMLSDPDLQNENHFFHSLNYNLPPEEYIFTDYLSSAIPMNMAHGQPLPYDKRRKLYVKATPEAQVEFLSPDWSQPRAIVSIASPVLMGQMKNNTEDNVVAMSVQDSLLRLTKGASIPTIVTSLLANSATIVSGPTTLLGGLGPNPAGPLLGADSATMSRNLQYEHTSSCFPIDNKENNNHRVLRKAAIPLFCGLPIEYGGAGAIYGPWINHPGLIRADIFPDSGDDNIQKLEVENLIGGVKVNIDESLVPWNYGGMSTLDEAVMMRIAEEVNYQQTLEMGTVQIPGFDNFSLGDMIRYYGSLFDGPIINSIQVQIADGGISTTYNFRTYIRKFGLFNKENAERLKAIGQETVKRNKEINTQLLKLASKINASIKIFN